MKRFLIGAVSAAVIASAASAQVSVGGYVRSDGTYVAPHFRSSPDSTPYNNYSTRPNVNPYTGNAGTRNPGTSQLYNSRRTSSSYPSGCIYNCRDD